MSLARDSWRLAKRRASKFRALPIYDAEDNGLLLKTSRQSTKTTLLRNKMTYRSLNRPGNAALYVAPTGNQVSDFSKKKLDTVFAHNKALKAYTKGGDWNVTFKQFMMRDGISRSAGRGGARWQVHQLLHPARVAESARGDPDFEGAYVTVPEQPPSPPKKEPRQPSD